MEMSEREIYLSYRKAKRPKDQIQVLADLNDTSPKNIERIIEKLKAEEKAKKYDEKQATLRLLEIEDIIRDYSMEYSIIANRILAGDFA